MELIKCNWGVMCLNDIDQFSVFVNKAIKDFLHGILFIHQGTKESKFIGTSFNGMQEGSDGLQTPGEILKVVVDFFNVDMRQFDIGIGEDDLCFTRGCGTSNEWKYGG